MVEFLDNSTETELDVSATDQPAPIGSPFRLYQPNRKTIPFVFASPHSGRYYPSDFVSASRLDPLRLRRSEDSFVDELFAGVPDAGAPLLAGHYARAYVDTNREPYELDPGMFEEVLPDFVNTKSVRVSAGLGTVPRVVSNGEEIYNQKLRFEEAEFRIENVYMPYHEALTRLVDETKTEFGKCILIDCHSMPSAGGPLGDDPGRKHVDIVLGNNYGNSCAPELKIFVDEQFTRLGLTVHHNNPYSGGYTTIHYGCPRNQIHTLQIEINRSLYMDEESIQKHAGFADLAEKIYTLLDSLGEFRNI